MGAMTVWIGSARADQAAGTARQSQTTQVGGLESPRQADDAKVYITAEDVLNLRLDYIYINFHTEANPAGEIRGNLVSAS